MCDHANRFCPSVFFYLLSVVPAIWFLELNEMERRIEEERLRRNKTMTLYQMGNATAYDIFVNTMPVLKVLDRSTKIKTTI